MGSHSADRASLDHSSKWPEELFLLKPSRRTDPPGRLHSKRAQRTSQQYDVHDVWFEEFHSRTMMGVSWIQKRMPGCKRKVLCSASGLSVNSHSSLGMECPTIRQWQAWLWRLTGKSNESTKMQKSKSKDLGLAPEDSSQRNEPKFECRSPV
jgi:hypothetical protein